MDEEIVYSGSNYGTLKYLERGGIKDITDTSMGCSCEYAICTICKNEAHTEMDFCEHVLNYKGSTFNGHPVWEDNRGIEFFEDSFVTVGADQSAKILERVASTVPPINRINKTPHSRVELSNVVNEKNQRYYENHVKSLMDEIRNIKFD